jgi:translation initiation factor IF-2
MDKRFTEVASDLGFSSVEDLRARMVAVGLKPPARDAQLIKEAEIEKWEKKLRPVERAEEGGAGTVKVRRTIRAGEAPVAAPAPAPTAAPEPTIARPMIRTAVRAEAPPAAAPPVVAEAAPAAPAPVAVAPRIERAPEPVAPPVVAAAVESEPASDADARAADASGPSPDGVRKRTKFATVVTREFVATPPPAPEPVVVEAPVFEPEPEPIPSVVDEDVPAVRKPRFATIVTREPAVPTARAPELAAPTQDDFGPDASASPIVRSSRFQTVVTSPTGEASIGNLSPMELAALARREADRSATGARVVGSMSREVLSERMEVERRDFGGPGRPRPGAVAAPGAAPAGDPRDDKKKAKKGKRIVQSRDLYDKSAGGGKGSAANNKKKGGKGMPSIPAPRPNATAEHKRVVRMEEAILVSDLGMQMSIKSGEIVMKLAFDLGLRGATINTSLDLDTATLIAELYGYKVEQIGFDINRYLPDFDDQESDYEERPPVVTVMGHVDHGKTSLLDAIRKTSVAGGEAGGITQHIGAYTVNLDSGRITFLDTPGHEAFSALRARGAKATDIVILVIAADDGVMPQTVEAIKHAQDAKVPIIVALNKIDKPGADPMRIKQALTEYELVPEEWGGTTIYVETSAKSGIGVIDLLEMVNIQAEVMQLTANPKRFAEGLVIESKLDTGRGPVATVLVQQGVLKIGQTVVIGQFYGRVRTLSDERGTKRPEATPSTPVEITGLNGVPAAGEKFYVVDSEKNAKAIAEHVANQVKQAELAVSIHNAQPSSGDVIADFMKAGRVKELKVIVKGDVQGSVQALCQSIQRLSTEKVRVRIVHSGVGSIIENDVNLATSTDDGAGCLIIGFNVRPELRAQGMAEQHGVAIYTHNVIYDILTHVTDRMRDLLDPVYVEEYQGKAECRAVFELTAGKIAGSMVLDGHLERNAKARVLRGGKSVHESSIQSIRHHKDDVRDIRAGFECGIQVSGFTDIMVGDIIECFKLKQIQATL